MQERSKKKIASNTVKAKRKKRSTSRTEKETNGHSSSFVASFAVREIIFLPSLSLTRNGDTTLAGRGARILFEVARMANNRILKPGPNFKI